MAKASKSRGIGLNVATAPAYRPSAEDKAREMRYRAEDDLRTLQRAEEVRKDRGRLGMAQRVAKEQVKALSTIAGRKGGR